jgi:hypothetical protein
VHGAEFFERPLLPVRAREMRAWYSSPDPQKHPVQAILQMHTAKDASTNSLLSSSPLKIVRKVGPATCSRSSNLEHCCWDGSATIYSTCYSLWLPARYTTAFDSLDRAVQNRSGAAEGRTLSMDMKRSNPSNTAQWHHIGRIVSMECPSPPVTIGAGSTTGTSSCNILRAYPGRCGGLYATSVNPIIAVGIDDLEQNLAQ